MQTLHETQAHDVNFDKTANEPVEIGIGLTLDWIWINEQP